MNETKGHPAAPILAEIAEAAKNDQEFWFEFQWAVKSEMKWFDVEEVPTLYRAIVNPILTLRRKPRTVRVSGEVTEELLAKARRVTREYPPESRVGDLAREFLALAGGKGFSCAP